MVEEFEDLDCWKEARHLVNEVYKLTNNKGFEKDYGLRNQIRRAAVSAITNIAEGFARFSKKEFIHFLDISQSSSTEVQSLLYIAYDQDYINKKELKDTYSQALSTKKINTRLNKIFTQKTVIPQHLNT